MSDLGSSRNFLAAVRAFRFRREHGLKVLIFILEAPALFIKHVIYPPLSLVISSVMRSLYTPYGDALLWVCLGFLGTLALRRAHIRLLDVREAARITNEEKEHDEIISQKTEDGALVYTTGAEGNYILKFPAVKLETLGELLKSPSYEIRQAAIKIITERAGRDAPFQTLIHSVLSSNPTHSARALASLRFLIGTPISPQLLHPPLTSILITYLASRLPLSHSRPHTPTDHLTRPPPERDALLLLSFSAYQHPKAALDAGLVSRWLSQYPLCGPDAAPSERVALIHQLAHQQTDDFLLENVVRAVFEHPQGKRELRGAGLVGGNFSEEGEGELGIRGGVDLGEEIAFWVGEMRARGLGEGGVRMGEGRELRGEMDGMQRAFEEEGGRVRNREESPEEMALRRRRRMAMAISDGGPLSGENIHYGAGDGWEGEWQGEWQDPD